MKGIKLVCEWKNDKGTFQLHRYGNNDDYSLTLDKGYSVRGTLEECVKDLEVNYVEVLDQLTSQIL